MTTPEDKEPFLRRWSRLKQEAGEQPPASEEPPQANEAPPELPPVESLTPESDFRGFMHPKVGEDLRRAALKKMFGDPHFNVMDGLDVYIDDYSKSDPLPAAMLAQLKQAQKILEWAKELPSDADPERQRVLADKQQRIAPPVARPSGASSGAPMTADAPTDDVAQALQKPPAA